MKNRSIKYVVKEFISNNLNEGLDLSTLIKKIEIEFKHRLSELDLLYIEYWYIDLLLTKWLQQVPEYTIRSIGSERCATLLKQLCSLKSFRDCSSCSCHSKFSLLILHHYDQSPRLRELEEISVLEFRKACLNLIQLHVENIGQFDGFFSKFVTVLKTTPNLQKLSQLFKFEDFIDGTITCEVFIRNIHEKPSSNKDIIKLQQESKIIANLDLTNLSENLKEIIKKFLEPVDIEHLLVDGRSILEVTGTYIQLSEQLTKLECAPNFNQIDEIRIVNASVLHADVNLINSVWHGKNLVISAETVIVNYKDVVWDVSGVNGEEIQSVEASAELMGANGSPGESGGNVLVMVDSVEGGTLTIVSNGGKGGRGYDGVPGVDGEHGDCMHAIEFKKSFPPPSSFWDSDKVQKLKSNKESISKKLHHAHTFYFNGLELKNLDSNSLTDWLLDGDLNDFYIKGKTETGCEITFSFYVSGFFSRCQSYLLYKAAPGKEGKPGGTGGSGGQGGLAGDVKVHIRKMSGSGNIVCEHNNGKNGSCGKPGTVGKPGVTGGDCGFMDVSLSSDWPKIFVIHPDDNNVLTVEYSDNSDGVYCPYMKEYAKIKHKEKQIKLSTHDYTMTFANKFNSLSDHEVTQAIRKKTIDLKSMQDQYHRNTVSDQLLFSLETEINSVNELLSKQLQSDEIVIESKMTRTVSFCNSNKLKSVVSKESVINGIENHMPEKIICDQYQGMKYKLLILNKIEREYFRPANFKNEFRSDLRWFNDNYDKILFVNNYQEDFVTEYFVMDSVESRKKVEALFCNTSYQDELDDIFALLSHSFNFNDSQPNPNINLTRAIIISIAMLLQHNDFSKLHRDLSKCILEEDAEGRSFKNILLTISSHPFLKKMYQQYQFEYRKTHNLISGIDNVQEEHLRAIICDNINKFGPLDEFYREFLSRHFNKNVLLYSLDEEGKIKLVSNHNHLAEAKHHILLKDQKFHELSVNVNLGEILHHQHVMGSLYTKILSHIDSFTEKKHFDQFNNSSPYTRCIFQGVEKSIGSYVKLIQIINQEKDIETIKSHFNPLDDKFISPRLQKIKVEFIGYTNILHYISLHFENYGASISTREFCLVLNFILESALTFPKSISLISWIIASSPPTDWLVEFTLIKLEIYLNKVLNREIKDKWRKYLSNSSEKPRLMAFYEKICDDKCNVNVECMEELLYLLSCTPRAHVGLELIDLRHWKYYLKDKYWLHQLKVITSWPEEFVNQASLHFTVMDNYRGFKQANEVLKIIKNHSSKVENGFHMTIILDFLRDLSKKEICLDAGFIEVLLTTTLQDGRSKVEEACFDSGNERSVQQLVELVGGCGNTSEKIKENLSMVEKSVGKVWKIQEIMSAKLTGHCIQKFINCFLKFFYNKEESWKKDIFTKIMQLVYSEDSEESMKDKIVNDYDEMVLALIIIVIKDKCNINLRYTQQLSILMFLKNRGNLLAQVSTGEGKSLIIVCVAIINAIKGKKVDIITSSHVLAERDAKEYSKIYKMFGFNVGHNCSENVEKRKKVYSNCQIVYGELSSFQRDFLLDRVYDKNILGDRSFETILVDEVDSLLLDRGNNTLYLSHEIPGLDKLEPLFVYIWKWLNTCSGQSELELKEDIMTALGHINKDHLRELDTRLSETAINEIWKVLVNEGIIQETGIVVKDQIDYNMLESKTKDYINISHLKYLCNKVLNNEKPFVIPNYLKGFVYRHLDKWIRSAHMALCLENGRHYVVDVDRTGSSDDRSPNITILDPDTGTDLASSQWENGLHQFLQLKHGCKTFSISLKAVFISNVSYVKKYTSLFGLSGTLGTSMERTLLIDLYKVEYITIPTAKAKLFSEMPPITFKDRYNWAKEIFNSCHKIALNRSVLIICESVNDVEFLNDHFNKLMKENNSSTSMKVHTYTRDYKNLSIADNLEQSQIIISTNLAGRGTDIKLSKQLIENGGLHVCLTFLPKNSRVEEQAYGRVARNGQPGTAQTIFLNNCENSISNIVNIKKQRDFDEIYRITSIKHIYETQILAEEKHFGDFQRKYLELRDKGSPENIKLLLLQVCLDKWALWLDEHIESLISASNEDFINDIAAMYETGLKNNFDYIDDPFHLTKLGFIHLTDGDYETSKLIFDKVIREEKNFSEAALYYRVCAKAKDKDYDSSSLPDLLQDFTLVESILKKHISSANMSGCFIDFLKNRNLNNIIQIESYKKQQEQICCIYSMFLSSIYQIIGQEVTPYDMLMVASGEKGTYGLFTGYRVYKNLMKNDIVKQPKMKPFDQNDLTFAIRYGIHPSKLSTILKENEHLLGSAFKKNNLIGDNNNKKEIVFWRKLKQLFPSRELFWNELVANNVLELEAKYLFIDFNRLEEEMPYLSAVVATLNQVHYPSEKNIIWLYNKDEFMTRYCNLLVVKKHDLRSIIGLETYTFLKKHGILQLNKHACIGNSWDSSFKFKNFDSLKEHDFDDIGIDSEGAKEIISELLQKNIIEKDSANYSLICNEEDIKKIQLSCHPAYRSDVISLLMHCFSFRIAYQHMISLIAEFGTDDEHVFFPLQSRLHKLFLDKLQEKLCTKPMVNHENKMKLKDKLKNVYPQSMDVKQWVEIFNIFFSPVYASQIILILQEMEWLLANKARDKWHVNCTKTVDDSDGSANYILLNKKDLPPHLLPFKVLIRHILLEQLRLNDALVSIEMALSEKVGQIYSKDTPDFNFKPLLSILKDMYKPIDGSRTFCLNGFDQIMSVTEKHYTFKMKLGTVCIAALGAVEIAAGLALMCYTSVIGEAAGDFCLSEGVADIIYSLNCLCTGLLNFNDYFKYKLNSMTASAFRSCCKGVKLYRSKFGQLSSGSTGTKSLTSSYNIVKCIKPILNRAAADVYKNVIISQVIDAQLQKMGESLTTMIDSNIHKTIVEHEVIQSVKKVYDHLGEKEARKLCNDYFIAAANEHRSQTSDNLSKTFSVCKTTMGRCFSMLKNDGQENQSLLVIKLFHDFQKLIQTTKTCWSHINSLVSAILDAFQQKLDNSFIISEYGDHHGSNYTESECEYFVYTLIDGWEMKIKDVLAVGIHENILSPLFLYTSGHLHSKLLDHSIEDYSYFTDDEIQDMTKSKYKEPNFTECNDDDFLLEDDFVESQYNRQLFSLLNLKRDILLLTEISKRNLSLDIHFINICCEVVTSKLIEEGIQIPPFEIVIDVKGVQKRWKYSVDGDNITTIYLTSESLLSNNQSLCIKTLVHSVVKALCPKISPHINDLLGQILGEVDMNESIRIKQISGNKTSDGFVHHINTESENMLPYQHKYWKFKPSLDVDLRKMDILLSKTSEEHIAKGFDAALGKVNQFISINLLGAKGFFEVCLQDFIVLQQEIWPRPTNIEKPFHSQAMRYELVLPLPIERDVTIWEFIVNLTLVTKFDKKAGNSPLGPHIIYEVRPLTRERDLERSVKGHVLLHSECCYVIPTPKQCHVAGELILPSGIKFLKSK